MRDIVKAGWVEKPLGEISTLQRGFDLPKRLREAGEFPLVTSSGPTDTHSEAKVKGPGVATGRSGSIGNVFFIEDDFWPLNTALYVKDFHGNDPRFVYHLLHYVDLSRFASGAGVPTLNRNDVHVERYWIPTDLLEQQRIVAVLDEAFEGLAHARTHAEANLQNARELFESYREEYLEPTSRDGWSSVQLDQLIDIKHGFAFKSAFFEDDGQYAVLTPGNYYETGGFKDRGEKQRYYSGEFPREFILNKGDLLVAMTEQAPGLLGSCMIVPEDARFLHNQRLGLITPKSGVTWSAEYFAQAFNLKAFRKGLSDTCSGATVRHTSPKRILAERVPYCEDVAQLDLAAAHLSERADDCRLMEKSYRAKLQDLDELRQSLLQKAFAGELT